MTEQEWIKTAIDRLRHASAALEEVHCLPALAESIRILLATQIECPTCEGIGSVPCLDCGATGNRDPNEGPTLRGHIVERTVRPDIAETIRDEAEAEHRQWREEVDRRIEALERRMAGDGSEVPKDINIRYGPGSAQDTRINWLLADARARRGAP